MEYLLKYDSTSEISTTEEHDCPGVVLCGTSVSNYKMTNCDFGEDRKFRIVVDSSGDLDNYEYVPANQIWYTSTDGNVVTPNYTTSEYFGANVVSNVYSDGKGVMTFDGSVTGIGIKAFYHCTTLKTVSIPCSVTTIANNALNGCTYLTTVRLPYGIISFGQTSFSDCTNLVDIILPKTVTTLGTAMFQYCTNLANIIIPNSVTTINPGVFYVCSNLQSIYIPDSVTSIGYQVFASCSNLRTARLSNNITSIERNSFRNCTSLTSITIPNSVTSIGKMAFLCCYTLNSITLPDSLVSFSQEVFVQCLGIDSFHFGPNVATLGDGTSVTYNDIFPALLETITIDSTNPNFEVYDLGVYSKDGTNFYGGADWGITKTYTKYYIKEGVTTVHPGSFRCLWNSDYTQEWIDQMFTQYHYTRSHIYLTDRKIEEVIFPSTTTFIGDRVLQYSTGLTSITVLATTPPTLYTSSPTFDGSYPIYVPAASVDAYKAASNWSDLASRIQAIS